MIAYLDTNIFLYGADSDSKYYTECINFIKFCQKEQIILLTSVETVQEIIHYAKNIKQIERGLEIANFTLNSVDQLVSITPETIKLYLKEAESYLKASSRDLIHLATCQENNYKVVITFDKDFSRFTQIKSYTPQQFIDHKLS